MWAGGLLSPITRHALTFTAPADAVMSLTSVRSAELHQTPNRSRKASWETFIREFSASVSCLYGGNILIQDKIRESVTGAGQFWVKDGMKWEKRLIHVCSAELICSFSPIHFKSLPQIYAPNIHDSSCTLRHAEFIYHVEETGFYRMESSCGCLIVVFAILKFYSQFLNAEFLMHSVFVIWFLLIVWIHFYFYNVHHNYR